MMEEKNEPERHIGYLSLKVNASTGDEAANQVAPLTKAMRARDPKTNAGAYKVVLPSLKSKDRRAKVFVRAKILSKSKKGALGKMKKVATALNRKNPSVEAKAFIPKIDKEAK